MFSVDRLIVSFALLALAVAAPPRDNDIQQITEAYNVPLKAELDSGLQGSAPASTVAAVTVPPATVPAVTIPAATVPVANVPPATVTEAANPAVEAGSGEVPPKPVNERFPHAVLFGGGCGGTIISPTWVLTAAHCTLVNGGRYVIAGTNNTENESGVTRTVKRLIIHPLFSAGPYWLDAKKFNIKQVAGRWDFMLAELKEPLPLDGKLMAAAKLDDQPNLPVGLNVAYAGYGTDHFDGYMRSKMHEMEMAVQSDETCSTLEQYDRTDMLCAKGVPPRFDSACSGDSGSGLVDNTGRVIGVVSWAEKDALACFNGALVVFARVSSARDWIRQITQV